MGPAARAHVRQDVPAHVRGVPGARPAAARRGVPPALRAAVDAGPDAVRPGDGGQRRRRRRPRRSAGPFLVVLLRHRRPGRRALPARLVWGDSPTTPTPPAARPPRRRATATATRRKPSKPKKKKKAAPARVVAAADREPRASTCASRTPPARPVINGDYLEPGKSSKTFRSQRFRMNFGNGDVTHARERQELSKRPTRASRSATRCGRARSPRDSPRPHASNSAPRERPRGHHRHRHRGPLRDHPRTPTGPGCRRRCARAASTLTHIVVVGDRPDDLRSALTSSPTTTW